MTYGTYVAIKEAIESLNLREDIVITVKNGEVDIETVAEKERRTYTGWEQA